ncbi:sugar phosphate nucleotidyltransferase [Flavobacterium sp. GT3P67]|uniref:sugar phosphate nucleotidyltransferase n=1 Tax=Flavobacterium sp. GT3P67 TaxID=2541722 RepID=UPI00104E236D|nr:sugar phosphate nucleotidyltransferase [Flavobacterium sp. GT3P67]TDE51305.1 CBS domain-containing protein [Flavobacterium sp. GT3P67]
MNKYFISKTNNIRESIKKIDNNGEGFIFIINDDDIVIGLVTDGDFRRAILNEVSLDENCMSIANKDFKYVESNYTEREIINIFLQWKIDHLPVLENGCLKGILFRKDFNLSGKVILEKKLSDVSVVIMAGGKGTRMKPFTNILPKPLIPVGDKSMLEVIMDEYNLHFQSKFHISVNYKANLIKAYLEDFVDMYDISYVSEQIPLGTGGALKYLEGKIESPFFVSNCDILIKANYTEIYNDHLSKNNDITIVASLIHYKVPYGVCEIENGGELKGMIEKPEYDFLVNAGMYILNPDVLKLIPEDEFYNITDLIDSVKSSGGKVGVFPVSENSYSDSGQWEEYRNMLNTFTN